MTGMAERLVFYMNMARDLRERRNRIGLHLKTVAKMTGLDIAEIKEMERGDVEITCFPFNKLMEYYDSIDDVGEKST